MLPLSCSHIKGRTWPEGVCEQGIRENIVISFIILLLARYY
jgi:hypothetical protein